MHICGLDVETHVETLKELSSVTLKCLDHFDQRLSHAKIPPED